MNKHRTNLGVMIGTFWDLPVGPLMKVTRGRGGGDDQGKDESLVPFCFISPLYYSSTYAHVLDTVCFFGLDFHKL